MKLTQELLVDALAGVGISNYGYADRMTKAGLAIFTGNQWNESWRWNRTALQKLTLKDLCARYQEAKSLSPNR